MGAFGHDKFRPQKQRPFIDNAASKNFVLVNLNVAATTRTHSPSTTQKTPQSLAVPPLAWQVVAHNHGLDIGDLKNNDEVNGKYWCSHALTAHATNGLRSIFVMCDLLRLDERLAWIRGAMGVVIFNL